MTLTYGEFSTIGLLEVSIIQIKMIMKNYNQVEVIFFSKYSLTNLHHKQQVRWLGTIAQSAIERQNEKAKKLFLTILNETPAIYLS